MGSFYNPSIPIRSSTSATVRPSTPGVRDPALPPTRSNATINVAGSYTKLNRSSNLRPGSAARPTVKFGLHLRYPPTRPYRPLIQRCATIRGCLFRHYSLRPFSKLLPPFPMCTGSPRLGVLRRLRPAPDRSADDEPGPTRRTGCARTGVIRDGSHVHCDSLDEGGAQLCPCGIATATPQHVTVASRTDIRKPARKFPAPSQPTRCAPRPAHIRQIGAGLPFEGRTHAGSSRTPLRHARRTRTIWQYSRVPALSGLLPPIPAPPGTGCPQLTVPAATGPAAKVSHLRSKQQRLVAHAGPG